MIDKTTEGGKDNELAAVSKFIEQRFPAGTAIYELGQSVDLYAYRVVSGMVQVSDPETLYKRVVGEGGFFGWRRHLNATALTDVIVEQLEASQLRALLHATDGSGDKLWAQIVGHAFDRFKLHP